MRLSTGIAAGCGCLMLALAFSSPVLAQGQGRRGAGGGFGGGGRGVSELQLLQSAQVQKELGLADDKIAKIKEVADGSRGGFAGLRDLSQEERRAKMAEAAKEQKAKLDAILSPEQQTRLAEISLQVRGASALSDEAVQAKLGITADQKAALTTAREENQKAMAELFTAGGAGGDRAANQEKMQKAQAEATAKLLAVLTADQKATFEKLQGKKIEIDRAALRGGGAGGAGRGRRAAN